MHLLQILTLTVLATGVRAGVYADPDAVVLGKHNCDILNINISIILVLITCLMFVFKNEFKIDVAIYIKPIIMPPLVQIQFKFIIIRRENRAIVSTHGSLYILYVIIFFHQTIS